MFIGLEVLRMCEVIRGEEDVMRREDWRKALDAIIMIN